MERQSVGDIIRDLRKRKQMTQEDLADGICSPVTISRIENGNQMPSSKVLEMILSKLGTSTYEICNIYYKSDQQMRFEEKAGYVAQLLKQGQIVAAKELLGELAKELNDNDICEQYYGLLEISLMIYENVVPELIIENCKRILNITKKNFDYANYNVGLLTSREANIVSLLIIGLYKNKQIDEAIALSEKLLKSLEKHKNSLKDYGLIRLNVMMNLSQCMESEGRYSEAFDVISVAEQMSYTLSEYTLLPEILFLKAKLYHCLGDNDSSLDIIKSIVPYMELIHKNDFASVVKEFSHNKLNVEI